MVAVETPRGRIEVMQQEMRGLRQGSGCRMFWFARRAGKQEWAHANTPQEAIRKATLLPPGKAAGWLERAAAEVRSQLDEGASASRIKPTDGSLRPDRVARNI